MSPLALEAAGLAEPWRLWTCHFVHWDAGHALWSAAALLAPFPLLAPSSRWRLLRVLAALAPVLSLTLLPWLRGGAYGGLSGLAGMAWAFAGLELGSDRRHEALGQGLLLLLAAKVGIELATGAPLLSSAATWHDLPAAHLNGAILGGLAWGPARRIRAGRP